MSDEARVPLVERLNGHADRIEAARGDAVWAADVLAPTCREAAAELERQAAENAALRVAVANAADLEKALVASAKAALDKADRATADAERLRAALRHLDFDGKGDVSANLSGVLHDVGDDPARFDAVCLRTVREVHARLVRTRAALEGGA